MARQLRVLSNFFSDRLLARKEVDYELEMVCIDPHPSEFLKRLGRRDEIELLAQQAQSVPLDLLVSLGGSGMLFIDSTHTVKPGSEGNLMILEVLPRLKRGSCVHFHDIYFPYDYQRGILTCELFFSNEAALLHAFLINNSNYRLRASLSMLHYARPEELQKILPNYKPAPNDFGVEVLGRAGHFPSSAYLQVT